MLKVNTPRPSIIRSPSPPPVGARRSHPPSDPHHTHQRSNLIPMPGRPGATTGAKEKVLTSHASGTFEVKVAPQAPDAGGDEGLGRMSLDKQFHGDLEATSKGQMLAAMSSVPGSGGYVALERVTGTLKGKSGRCAVPSRRTLTGG